jgi:hypothetical protein
MCFQRCIQDYNGYNHLSFACIFEKSPYVQVSWKDSYAPRASFAAARRAPSALPIACRVISTNNSRELKEVYEALQVTPYRA